MTERKQRFAYDGQQYATKDLYGTIKDDIEDVIVNIKTFYNTSFEHYTHTAIYEFELAQNDTTPRNNSTTNEMVKFGGMILQKH